MMHNILIYVQITIVNIRYVFDVVVLCEIVLNMSLIFTYLLIFLQWYSYCTRYRNHSKKVGTLRGVVCWQDEEITVNPRNEQLRSVVIGENSSWASVTQSNGSREGYVRVELRSYQWNTERMWVDCYANDMVGPRCRTGGITECSCSEHSSWK